MKLESSSTVPSVALQASEPGSYASDPRGAKVHIFVNRVISIAGESDVIAAVRVRSEFRLESPRLIFSRDIEARGAIETGRLNLRFCADPVGRQPGALRPAPGESCRSQRGQGIGERLPAPQHLKRL